MSRIYFHSPSGDAELRGSERAYMGVMMSRLALAVFDPGGWDADKVLRRVVPPTHYAAAREGRAFADAFQLMVSVSDNERFELPAERRPSVFTVCLNTALAIGNDAVKLMARLHGQCEIHAWVDGPNRVWLAEIVERGRQTGVLRPDQGWGVVGDFLRSSETEPVVTSYSVCDSFPNAYVAGYSDDRDNDGWYDLSHEEQWTMAMGRLRAAEGEFYGLELRPDQWAFADGFYFGAHPDTAYSVLEAAYAYRETEAAV